MINESRFEDFQDWVKPLMREHLVNVKDAANPYVNQATAECCSSLDEAGFKQLPNSPDATCRNLNAGSKAGKTILHPPPRLHRRQLHDFHAKEVR
jgi:hypothetical protein